MFSKLNIAVGFAAGLAVGAKIGEQRVARLQALVRDSSRHPAFRQLAGSIASAASTVTGARGAISRTDRGVSDRQASDPGVPAASGPAIPSEAVLIDELSESELDRLTAPEPP